MTTEPRRYALGETFTIDGREYTVVRVVAVSADTDSAYIQALQRLHDDLEKGSATTRGLCSRCPLFATCTADGMPCEPVVRENFRVRYIIPTDMVPMFALEGALR